MGSSGPSSFATCCALLALLGCGGGESASVREAEEVSRWITLVSTPTLTVELDSTHSAHDTDALSRIVFRTTHSTPRYHKAGTWNREVARSLVWCDSLAFRPLSVTLALDDATPIVTQQEDERRLWDKPWRRVEPESDEALIFRLACDRLPPRPPPRPTTP